MSGLSILKRIAENGQLTPLFVDLCLLREEKGSSCFSQREPGCIKAYFRGLAYIVNHFHLPLSMESIQSIHREMSTQVKGGISGAVSPGEYRRGGVAFGIFPQRVTYDGLMQLIDNHIQKETDKPQLILSESGFILSLISTEHVKQAYSVIKKTEYTLKYIAPFTTPQQGQIEQEMKRILAHFQQEMAEAGNGCLRDKVRVMAAHIQRFELLHPFADANGRVFVNGVLNWMLLSHNLPPAVFEEPNVFDLYSIEQLTDVILEACYASCELALNSNAFLYGVRPGKDEDDTAFLQQALQEVTPALDENIKVMQQQLISACRYSFDHTRDISFGRTVVWSEDQDFTQILAYETELPFYRGKSLLHLAILAARDNVIKDILLKAPQLVNCKDAQGCFPVEYSFPMQDINLSLKLLPNIGLNEKKQNDILNAAAAHFTPENFKTLLRHVPFTKNSSWNVLLRSAVDGGNVSCFKYFLQKDCGDESIIYEEIIESAAEQGLGDIVNALMLHKKDDEQSLLFRAAMGALKSGQDALLNDLITNNSLWTFHLWTHLIIRAMEFDRERNALELIDRFSDAYSVEALYSYQLNNNYLFLHVAVRTGCLNIFKKIIESDEKFLFVTTTINNYNLLHLSVFFRRQDFLNHLLGKKSLPMLEQCNDRAETPLALAVIKNYAEEARQLIVAGADCNIMISDSKPSPSCAKITYGLFYWAVDNGHEEIIELLLDRQVDPTIPRTEIRPGLFSTGKNSQKTVSDLLNKRTLPDILKNRIREQLDLADSLSLGQSTDSGFTESKVPS